MIAIVAIGILGLVAFAAYTWQLLLAGRILAKVADKLTKQRTFDPVPRGWRSRLTKAPGLTFTMVDPDEDDKDATTRGQASDGQVLKIEGHGITTLDWTVEKACWEERAREIRRTFLDRTEKTAEKWRTVFAALVTVFGAVLVVNRPTLSNVSGPGKVALFLAIALALHAVAYTGWAAAGLPKMLVDVEAETAFEADTRQACYSLARLRIGIGCGIATAVALTVAFALMA